MTTPLHVNNLVAGQGGRIPLVLLHGFTGDSTTWRALVPHLEPQRPVWAVDLVGHGRSPAPDDAAAYTMPAAVADVAAALRGHGLSAAFCLGYSMGGRLALHLALAEPSLVQSLVLVGTSPGISDPAGRAVRVAEDASLAAYLREAGLEAFVDRWLAQPLFASQTRLGAAERARQRAQRLTNRPEALARVLEGMGTGAMEPVNERLGEISVPVLLVAGAEDAKFSALAQGMARRLPRAAVAILPGAGHAVHVEAPAALAAAVEAFLAALPAG